MGVELINHHIVECVGHSIPAEADLISKCADLATKQNKNEWFEGLEYLEVIEIAAQIASTQYDFVPAKGGALLEYFETQGRGAAMRLCESIGAFSSDVSNWANGLRQVPAERCPAIEQATGGLVRCEDLRPDVRWDVIANRQPEKAAA